MTIPKKEEFEVLSSILWEPDDDFLERCKGKVGFTSTEIRDALIKNNKERENYIDQIEKLPVSKFFKNQSGYKFYKETVFNLKRNKKRNLEFNNLTESEKLEIQVEHFTQNNYAFVRYLRTDPMELSKGVFSAFETYYYSEKWLKILNAQKNSFEIFSQAYKAVKRIDELQCLENFYGGGYYMLGFSFQRFVDKLDHFQHKENWDFPFIRKDEFYKERGLVYDLYIAHKKKFKATKAKAIGHLMTIEGVNSTFDSRSIERLIKGWKEAYLGETRHLRVKQNRPQS